MKAKRVIFIIAIIIVSIIVLLFLVSQALQYYFTYSDSSDSTRKICEDAETGETVYYSSSSGWDASFENVFNDEGEQIDWAEWPTGKDLDTELINCKEIEQDEFVEVRWDTPGTLYLRCPANNGRWLEEYKECERFSEELCDWAEGEYYPCESACRHNPEAVMCTTQCVEVCKFDPAIFE